MKSFFVKLGSATFLSSLVAAIPTASTSVSASDLTVQLNGLGGENAIQLSVPADNSLFPLNAVFDAFSGQIINADGFRFPSCLVFSDMAGTQFATEVSITTDETVLLLGSVGTVPVGSLRCTHQ